MEFFFFTDENKLQQHEEEELRSGRCDSEGFSAPTEAVE